MSISDDIADGLIDRDTEIMRVEASVKRKIRQMINGLSDEAIGMILKIDPTAATFAAAKKRRMLLLFSDVRGLSTRAYELIYREVQKDLGKLARSEATSVVRTINESIQIELLTNIPDLPIMTELAKNTLIQGAVNRDWWSQQGKKFTNRFLEQMREGVLLNESVSQLSRRVRGTKSAGFRDGIIRVSKHESDALVRTSIQSVAQNARDDLYSRNNDVIKGKQWLATLDTRTSDICIGLDGQSWTLTGEKLPGTSLSWRGPPPAHWNCRSTLVPVMKSFAELSGNPQMKRKLRKIEKDSNNGLEKLSRLDGNKAQRTTYDKWLRKQTKEKQLETLGPTKRKLWKSGKIKPTDLIDQSHRPLTVDELVSKFD